MKLFAVLLLCAVAATVVAAQQSCTYYNDETHQFYDLTPLR